MTTSPEPTIEQRIEQAIARALKMPAPLQPALRMGSTPGWDSMGHTMVVMTRVTESGGPD